MHAAGGDGVVEEECEDVELVSDANEVGDEKDGADEDHRQDSHPLSILHTSSSFIEVHQPDVPPETNRDALSEELYIHETTPTTFKDTSDAGSTNMELLLDTGCKTIQTI